ncbi:unconventional myosin-Vb isoform X2 [Colossoma macropomum]|uniref:unconventional myosin-Vb isoform X2 n=1 Tax=Colossoma macropomum TaxID=42526 RepID=UPI001863A146|nr:unconventional myosin-Vb isoform X2 [Colossoma macropomum]
MATPELYTKGANVWVPDPEEVWVCAQLQQNYRPGDQQLLLLLSDGRVQYPVAPPVGLPPLGNPDILEGENDLTALSFLHEPAVLHNLRVRFLHYNSIYTYCGIVLVALNPYEELPIYGEEVIDAYSGQDMADMDPHIFSLAEDAYRTMIREEKNQSIIISGESGSGKTVSAKFTMRYFAVVGGAAQQTSVEEKVLASNPIMESIGNAKTIRNDNSSRFGKYIEIGFGSKGDIIGANMRTYLLEKSRVVFQAPEERNYHVFYQLCASRDLPEMRGLKLNSAEDFRYTNQGMDINIPGTDDAMELEHTRNALTILGVQPDQQMELFRILAAVLHLGNVNIQASGRGGDRSYINGDDRSLVVFSKLMGVEGSQMAHWLCHQRLAVGGEMLVKPMSGQQANEARDALAKHIYGQLFAWIVQRLNSALRAQREQSKTFIGVLDIYGFETFDRNSFEQFCINYANEKLQQQFNRHVFQLEQEEYVREELPWNRIEFSDNQPCITLIEGSLGLLDLLDEECRVPKGSDENWARKLYEQHLNQSPNFRKPRMSNSAFIVLHFADMVQYECDGFLDKNRDTIFEEPINIMRASQSELVAELFQQKPVGGSLSVSSVPNGGVRSGKRAHREHKLTVGFQFRQSLHLLMGTLNSTTPHYVRCIKPNDLKQPFLFDPKRAVQQLRACGVLETIRISAAGYPSRWTYEEFFGRYRVLLHGSSAQDELQVSCQKAIPNLIPDPEQYCFGKTKVFFRAGQVAVLEKLRAERLWSAGVLIQSWVRGWIQRRRYLQLRRSTLTLQRYTRGALARRLAWTLRYTRAALIIQKTYRMVMVRQLYLAIREATITIQAFARGMQARRTYRLLLEERAAVRVQAWVRCWLTRRWFRRIRAAVVLLQCCVRRRAARMELRRLRAEARSVERYRELNKGMEVKLMQLQLRADQQAKESASLREALHTERESHSSELEQLRSALLKLQKQLQEQSHAAPSVTAQQEEERQKAEERAAQEIQRLTQEIEALRMERDSLEKERDDLNTRLWQQEKSQEESRQQTEVQAAAVVQAELEEERRRYQGLLREFTRLEQRYDNLRDMSMLPTAERWRGHRRTDSTQSLSLEPPSPISPSFSGPPDFSSAEEGRRISVTSPFDRRPWSPEQPLNALMEDLGVPKDTAGKMQGEDLRHAYDAVRVANKFLERQLLAQRAEGEQEKAALMLQLQEAQARDAPASKELKDLMEQMEVREQECCRLRRELKELKHTVTLRKILSYAGLAVSVSQEPMSPSTQLSPALTGLLECRKKDESRLMKNLITDVRAEVALSLTPGLAAQLLFLCVRQADVSRDHTRARGLCVAALAAFKTALKKHSGDLDMTALWLKNACVLKDVLTKHSPTQVLAAGEVVGGGEEVLPLQVELREQVRVLGDVCIQAYQQLLAISESHLQPIIVPAVLESETIPGLSGAVVKLVGSRKRAGSDPRPAVSGEVASMAAVLREFGALHTALERQDLPAALLEQAFRQLAHLLAASTLNSLLLRKDMCCWNRGLQIRYNVSLLEEWLRSRGLWTGGAAAALEPLIQAAQLLQMSKKTEVDGQAIVQTCNVLSSQQIVKILTQYTPQSDLEERVTLNFIRIVQGLLKGRSDGHPPQLLLDVRRVFPVTFPYLPPPLVSAEQLEIPESLKISFLRKV